MRLESIVDFQARSTRRQWTWCIAEELRLLQNSQVPHHFDDLRAAFPGSTQLIIMATSCSSIGFSLPESFTLGTNKGCAMRQQRTLGELLIATDVFCSI